MSTKSFIINLPIITGDQDRRRLRKSFSFGCNLQNAVMGGGWDRVLIEGNFFRTISAFNDKLQKRLKRLIVKETKMAAQAVDQGDKKQVFNSRENTRKARFHQYRI